MKREPKKCPNSKRKKGKTLLVFTLLLLLSYHGWAQEKKISGTIVDSATEQPLLGASILEKGTTNGVMTDFDGNFNITVSSTESILVISYVGYQTQEILVGDKAELNILLAEDLSELDEVVVVGYGKQKK